MVLVREGPPLDEIKQIAEMHEAQLSTLLRYDRYRNHQTESAELWVHLLGPDVVSISHPAVTSAITENSIAYNESHGIVLDPESRYGLQIVPWIHDWGELKLDGLGVGDITFEQKEAVHEVVELRIFHMVTGGLLNPDLKEYLLEVYENVAMNHETVTGGMFNAVERIGYLETAIRAHIGVDGSRIENWRGLTGNVLSHQTIALIAYASKNPYVAHVLEENAEQIDAMFDDVVFEPEIPMANDGKPSYDRQKLRSAYDAWAQYRDLNSTDSV